MQQNLGFFSEIMHRLAGCNLPPIDNEKHTCRFCVLGGTGMGWIPL